jgi:hypothetical protein
MVPAGIQPEDHGWIPGEINQQGTNIPHNLAAEYGNLCNANAPQTFIVALLIEKSLKLRLL